MANRFTPTDVYAIVNEIVSQATGQKSIAVVDTTSFVSVGATLIGTQHEAEKTLNAIGNVLARTIFSSRPYTGSLDILRASQERWGAVVRKIIPLPSQAEESTDYNTDINPTQLADGNSIDMYKIKNPKVIELNFWGTKKLQMHITRYQDQLAMAFKSESEFVAFIDTFMVEFFNSIERINEGKSRLVLANAIAGTYAMASDAPSCVVDLTAAYNAKFGTSYTKSDLLTTYLESFLGFFVGTVKMYSKRLKDSTNLYHANLTGLPDILHNSPKNMTKLICYEPFFVDAETQVLPQVFHPEKLDVGEYEGVNFWQDPLTPEKIVCKPTYLDVATAASTDASSAVTIDTVLAVLYDVEFMGVFPQFDYSSVTPFNSAGGYWNEYYHWRFNNWTDFTENHIIFIMS